MLTPFGPAAFTAALATLTVYVVVTGQSRRSGLAAAGHLVAALAIVNAAAPHTHPTWLHMGSAAALFATATLLAPRRPRHPHRPPCWAFRRPSARDRDRQPAALGTDPGHNYGL